MYTRVVFSSACLFSIAVFSLAAPANAVDVTACGQTVPAGEVGNLTANLTCNTASVALTLGKKATLEMNGFTIDGSSPAGVHCAQRRCTINGPGTINGLGTGFLLPDRVRADLTDLTISNCDEGVVTAGQRHKLFLTDVAFLNNDGVAAVANRIKAENLIVSGNSTTGDITLHGNKFAGTNVTVTDNGGFGLTCDKAKITNLTSTGNGNAGVMSVRRLKLIGSTVTGNDLLGAGYADIEAAKQPVLIDTTCGTSGDRQGGTWGLCDDD